jgi:putative hydrolase of the HAD superfamily
VGGPANRGVRRVRLPRRRANDPTGERLHGAGNASTLGGGGTARVVPDTLATLMKRALPITTLFLDIGGVLLTDGWDHKARRRAAMHFRLKFAEMEDRHHLTFDTYEEGKLSLDEYLDRVVFHQKRPFTPAAFRRFMFAQSKPYPEMIALVAQLKVRYGMQIAVVSNEARELNSHRIRKFKLNRFVDAFISSCFVHIRKPDPDMFRLALDISQAPPERIVYIENTPMFVRIAEGLGIRSILHTDCKSTREKLGALGLKAIE